MATRNLSLLGFLLAAACAAGGARAAAPLPAAPAPLPAAPALSPVLVRQLVVTSGRVETQSAPGAQASSGERFLIRSPTLRAWVGQQRRAAVELAFEYLGPSSTAAPLGSGELRRQIGLELRAQDSCNLVYVMWRIEPTQRLVVSVKSNPGQHEHEQCGDRGYVNVEPAQAAALPALQLGERHVLSANLTGSAPTSLALDVRVDGVSVWRGPLPAAAAALDGPVGLRSDNAEFQVQLRAGSPSL